MTFRSVYKLASLAAFAALMSSTASATVAVELPEPTSIGLLGLGLAGLATRALAASRRRNK